MNRVIINISWSKKNSKFIYSFLTVPTTLNKTGADVHRSCLAVTIHTQFLWTVHQLFVKISMLSTAAFYTFRCKRL